MLYQRSAASFFIFLLFFPCKLFTIFYSIDVNVVELVSYHFEASELDHTLVKSLISAF